MTLQRTGLAFLGALALAASWLPAPALADIPGQHPRYVHALSDVRHARWLLNHQNEWNAMRHEGEAAHRLDEAINDITQAAINDGKNVNQNFPEDGNLDTRGRLRRAREILQSALQDLTYNETNGAALGWRDKAVRHVNAAIDQINRAMHDAHWDHQNGH